MVARKNSFGVSMVVWQSVIAACSRAVDEAARARRYGEEDRKGAGKWNCQLFCGRKWERVEGKKRDQFEGRFLVQASGNGHSLDRGDVFIGRKSS